MSHAAGASAQRGTRTLKLHRLTPGRSVGQAASFDGKSFIQWRRPHRLRQLCRRALGDDTTYSHTRWPRGSIRRRRPARSCTQGSQDDRRAERPRAEPERRQGPIQLRHQVGRRRHPLRDEKTIPLNEWHHVALTYDGVALGEGVKLYVDGEDQARRDHARRPEQPGRARSASRCGSAPAAGRRTGSRAASTTCGSTTGRCHAAEVGMLADRTPVTEIAAMPEDERSRGADGQDSRLLPRARAAGQSREAPGRSCSTRGPSETRFYRKSSHRDGDGGDADAARIAPPDPRDVRQAGRSRDADAACRRLSRRRRRIRRTGWGWRAGWWIRRIR